MTIWLVHVTLDKQIVVQSLQLGKRHTLHGVLYLLYQLGATLLFVVLQTGCKAVSIHLCDN